MMKSFMEKIIFIAQPSNELLLYSIADYSICNSLIRPTYMLTYESASELLHLGLEEEAELQILSEAASLRLQWRHNQVIFLNMKSILLV